MDENRKQVILDFGSGNNCQNNKEIIKRMIDELCRIDGKKHDVVIKWQLFKKAGENIPLTRESFTYAFEYAKKCGYVTTASVFDFESFAFLKHFKDLPFIKIANSNDLYWLQEYIQESNFKSYISVKNESEFENFKKKHKLGISYNFDLFCCVSKYPADGIDYQETFSKESLSYAISDHTTSFKLFNMYNPVKIEWHYKLNDSIGLDAGPFAKTPQMLKEVL